MVALEARPFLTHKPDRPVDLAVEEEAATARLAVVVEADIPAGPEDNTSTSVQIMVKEPAVEEGALSIQQSARPIRQGFR